MDKITLRQQRYQMLRQKITNRYPDVKIKYKEHYWSWRYLPTRLRCSGTTLGKTIWMPFNNYDFATLAHEYQHEVDIQEMGLLNFMTMYLSPQIYSLFWFIFAIMALGFNLWIISIIMACIGVAFLLPWPSKGRVFLETRGYLMTLYASNTHNVHLVVDALLSWLYYKMVWTRIRAQHIVSKSVQKLDNQEDIPGISTAFKDVYEIIKTTEKTIL